MGGPRLKLIQPVTREWCEYLMRRTNQAMRVKEIELLHVAGCAQAVVRPRVAVYASPSVLVNGCDVMGRNEAKGAMCRLDIPTRDRLLAALWA